ncbi:MAG: alpha-(1-_3)-arabinofuranosyltransferase family protein, partial [Solirubrobacteraceae bacterium]|nr:alpha-(1->3)-arabinofuranosyltransferase family protein [Solirubrobacteraceae bacterium]
MRWRRERQGPIDRLRRLDDLTDSKRRAPERAADAELTPRLPRGPMLLASLFLFLLVLLQDAGRVSFETKFDLVLDPSAFLGRALHLWDATGGFGQVQNQAVGYVFPMGPFAILTHAIGLPDWIGQRLWM